jgi:hypothetical protein
LLIADFSDCRLPIEIADCRLKLRIGEKLLIESAHRILITKRLSPVKYRPSG